MKKYLFITGLILLTAMFALAGCGSSKTSEPKDTAAKITVTDDNGRTVSLKDVPQKIVPLSASFLEPLEKLDAGLAARVAAKTGISEKYKTALFDALGLATVGLGANAVVHNLPNSEYPVLFIASLAIGTIIGTRLDICGRFNALLAHCKGGGKLAEGLSTAILLFCIGTLSILGPIESRLNGNNTYLFTNATLDLVSSMIFASTYGFGIAIAAAVLFCWQGSIYLFAGVIAPYLTPGMMTEISLLGGIFLLSSGVGILQLRDCKTLNMLPSLLVPPLWFTILSFLQ